MPALRRYLTKVAANTPAALLYLDDPAGSGLTGEAPAPMGDAERGLTSYPLKQEAGDLFVQV